MRNSQFRGFAFREIKSLNIGIISEKSNYDYDKADIFIIVSFILGHLIAASAFGGGSDKMRYLRKGRQAWRQLSQIG
jgi:hypothetical protein